MVEKMSETRIVCHRGARLSAPENTFPSAEAALSLGGSIIELDIRQSTDGILYVMHDATVDRTTDGSGFLAEMKSSEIDRLDAGGWHHARHAGEPVPRLKDYLARFAERAGFYLEIKHADCADVAELVRDLDIEDRCFTFSFDPKMREQMRLNAPKIRRMIHWTTAGSVRAAIEDHHAEIVEFHEHDFDAGNILKCKEAGLEVMFYTDRPDVQRFREALKLQMDFVNIDHIGEFDELRRNMTIRSPNF
jgi:glycerophosphoryl diester phosphodiesterase